MTKGRIMKKLVAVATTMMLFAAMVVPVMAAPNTGQITVHKFSRSTPGVAHPDNAYSGEALPTSVVNTLGTPLDGVGFKLYEIDMTAVNTYLTAHPGVTVTGYSVGAGQLVTYTFSNGNTRSITATDFAAGAEQFTSSGRLTFGNNNLVDGYYLLEESTPPAGYTGSDPIVIKTPLTLNNGSGENRDIHVYPKNVDSNAPIVEKVIGGTPQLVNTGDVVPFKITSIFSNANLTPLPAPADLVTSVHDLYDATTLTYGSFVVTDQLASYFSYVDAGTGPVGSNDLTVYLVNGAGNQIGAALTAAEYDLTGVMPGTKGPGALIEVALTTAGIDAAIAANAVGLVVEFTAEYTGGASTGGAVTTISNSASVAIGAPGGSLTPPVIPPSEVHVPTASIIVDKVSAVSGPLQGAWFALAKGTTVNIDYDYTGASDATYTQQDLNQFALDYVVDSVTGLPIVGMTGANGKLVFNNVPYYDTGATYYLRELATVGGYELPTGHFQVVLEEKTHTSNDSQRDGANWISGAKVERTVTVVNHPLGTDRSFSLPLTGGAGTALFTAVGIIVMIGAAVIYLHGKKKNV